MNNQQLYLAWLRTVAPAVYAAAVRKATGQTRSLGGLGDDLLDSALSPNLMHSFLGDELAPITVDATYMDAPPITTDFSFDNSMSSGVNISNPAPNFNVPIDSGSATGFPASVSTGNASSTFANILTAVTAIGATVIGANNQSKLISLNTTRANQGLPPVDASGRVVSAYNTRATNSGLMAFERSITGGGGMSMPLILAALGIGAFFILKSKKSA